MNCPALLNAPSICRTQTQKEHLIHMLSPFSGCLLLIRAFQSTGCSFILIWVSVCAFAAGNRGIGDKECERKDDGHEDRHILASDYDDLSDVGPCLPASDTRCQQEPEFCHLLLIFSRLRHECMMQQKHKPEPLDIRRLSQCPLNYE